MVSVEGKSFGILSERVQPEPPGALRMANEGAIAQFFDGLRENAAAIDRAGDREEAFIGQVAGLQAGPAAGPEADRDIDIARVEIGQRRAAAQVQLDIGELRRESRRATARGGSPSDDERGDARDDPCRSQGDVSKASPSSDRLSRTRTASVWPSGVSATLRPTRSNKRVRSRVSRLLIAWLTALVVRFSSSAALAKLWCRAAASKAEIARREGGRDDMASD